MLSVMRALKTLHRLAVPAALSVALVVPTPALAQGGSSAGAPSPSRQAIDRAMQAYDAGNPQGAIAVLEPLLKQDQVDITALALLGGLYLETGRVKDARTILLPLTNREDADPAVLYNAARAARANGEPVLAEKLLERSVAKVPLSPAARELGLLRSRQGRLGETLVLLGPWVEKNPEDSEARLAAAQAAVRMGRLNAASQLLFPLDPDAPATRLLKGELAQLKGDPNGALEQLRPLLQTTDHGLNRDAVGLAADAHLMRDDPLSAVKLLENRVQGDAQLSLLLARAQRQLGRLDDAIATLAPLARPMLAPEKPEKTSPLAGAIVLEYGRALVAAKRNTEGEKALVRATEFNPRSRLAWENLAEALAGQGKAREAQEARSQSQRLAQQDAQPAAPQQAQGAAGPNLQGAGTANLEPVMEALVAGEPERGLTLVRAEAARVPQDLRPRLLETRILLSMNRTDEARRLAETTADRFPQSADAIYLRGMLRLADDDRDEAEADLRQALKIAPTHTAVMNDLAVLLMTEERYAEAKTLLERVLDLNPDDQLAQENLRALPTGS